MMNPYVLLGAGLALVLAALGGFKFGSDYQKGKHARETVLIEAAVKKAQEEIAVVVRNIKVVNQTNRTRIEREIVKVPDLTACSAGADVRRVLNDALSGRVGTDAATDGVLPSPDAP